MLLEQDIISISEEMYIYRINYMYSQFMNIYNGLLSLGVACDDTYSLFQYYTSRAWNNVIEPIPVSIYSWQLRVDTIAGIAGRLHSVTKETCQLILEVPEEQRAEVAVLLRQIAPRYKHFI